MDLVSIGWLVLFAILGLCFGSFFNVVILRSLSGESIVFPGSKCPKCGKPLKPWHNIPVLSYVLLKGKCAFCSEKISIQYPIVEILTMIIFVYSYLKFDLTIKTMFAIIIASCLLIMSATDLKEKLVDCRIAIGLAVVALLYKGLLNHQWIDCILGLVVGAVLLEVVARLGYLFVKDRAFGEADTYVAGALGACFGLSGLLPVLLYTLIVPMVYILPVFLYKQYKKGNQLTCVLFLSFILATIVYKFYFMNPVVFALMLAFGILSAMQILRTLKQEPNPMYLPLVPAFTLGALYYLYF